METARIVGNGAADVDHSGNQLGIATLRLTRNGNYPSDPNE
jgi:hypothetical protein